MSYVDRFIIAPRSMEGSFRDGELNSIKLDIEKWLGDDEALEFYKDDFIVDTKWDKFESDLTAVSKAHPEVILKVTRYGHDHGDGQTMALYGGRVMNKAKLGWIYE